VLFTSIGGNNLYKSAGLSAKYTAIYGSTLCTEELLEWADEVYVFEKMHTDRIIEHTGDIFRHKIINVDILDRFKFMVEELLGLLKQKLLLLIDIT
jgi:predicted protein tyrosine phosphatase